MHFGNPYALWALALAPLLFWVGWLARRRRRRAVEALGRAELIGKLYDESVPRWHDRRLRMGLAVYLLLGFSAARPQYGRIEQTISRSGVDVLIAIDTSPSMLATDVEPNRLEKAKESLQHLVRRFRGNRVGIIAFAGEAFLLCPMTLDHGLASLVLDSVDESSVGVPGTDLGRAIEVAQRAFERGGSGSSVLVLLTDGEDNEGRGLAAAEEAAEAGVRVFAIGIGTERGALVPDGAGNFKENEDGSKVLSRLDLASLDSIAKATGGIAYAGGDNPTSAVNSIVLRIDRMQKSELESREITIHQDRYGWFLAPALGMLLWLLVSHPRQQRKIALAMSEASHGGFTR